MKGEIGISLSSQLLFIVSIRTLSNLTFQIIWNGFDSEFPEAVRDNQRRDEGIQLKQLTFSKWNLLQLCAAVLAVVLAL